MVGCSENCLGNFIPIVYAKMPKRLCVSLSWWGREGGGHGNDFCLIWGVLEREVEKGKAKLRGRLRYVLVGVLREENVLGKELVFFRARVRFLFFSFMGPNLNVEFSWPLALARQTLVSSAFPPFLRMSGVVRNSFRTLGFGEWFPMRSLN